ncbi:MAG: bifunctional diaminohydroxyphosphoribosylaminopyrimidine deaminase/5-amino-6-(5-phosphoribosylamino)uracil reductase RibD [Ignavibacteriae bacterium]|nr:bifunctional diaminohydroxyphosphoribosylaminopyrimidine deaminase/5-amino-6-(5-phosphoribosylamino)uracil reductase RibD [Ignavibacteriota bacterium]
MENKEFFIGECIKLAAKGAGNVSPNPLVGCVIVKNNRIIGKGWHRKFGGPHAEVNAISDAKKKGHSLKNSELYVNLEPCPHHGKTPPCTDLIIHEKISKVFIGIKDPNKSVNGKGIAKLKRAGIKVEYGILANACRELNKFFIKSVTKRLPYVTLKIAQSIDGKIALDNNKSKYITGNESLEFVHTLRSEYDAVLIGKNTAKLDNPSLTVRLVKGRNPFRIVIDRNSKLPANLKLFTDNNADKTIVINSTDGKFIPYKNIIKALHELGINSILVEGGAGVFSGFIKENLFDDIYFISAPVIIGSGISPFRDFKITTLSEAKNIFLNNIFRTGNDLVLHYKK